GNNLFRTIPNFLPQTFPHLTYLDFSHNKILAVPPNLSDLEDLELLDVEGNTELPSQLPPTLRSLVDMGKLMVFHEPPEDLDVEMDVDEDEDAEKPKPKKSEYYETDEEDEDDDEDGGGVGMERGGSRGSVKMERTGSSRGTLAPEWAGSLTVVAMARTASASSVASSAGLEPLSTDALREEARLFFARVVAAEDAELESTLRRRWAVGDAALVKYVARRYAQEAGKPIVVGGGGPRRGTPREGRSDDEGSVEGGESDDEALVARKAASRQVDFARKVKERNLKQELREGRKMKASLHKSDE
ncbi:hypothetical protein BDK51DRAFT_26713, partial [Blyttiomyces helicus]